MAKSAGCCNPICLYWWFLNVCSWLVWWQVLQWLFLVTEQRRSVEHLRENNIGKRQCIADSWEKVFPSNSALKSLNALLFPCMFCCPALTPAVQCFQIHRNLGLVLHKAICRKEEVCPLLDLYEVCVNVEYFSHWTSWLHFLSCFEFSTSEIPVWLLCFLRCSWQTYKLEMQNWAK